MASILLLETSTNLCSVGLAQHGMLRALREDSGLNHAEKANTFIHEVCDEAGIALDELDAISVGGGPGSYTGLRIGVSIAKGLCFALDIPLIAIPSLRTIANGIRRNSDDDGSYLVSMIDARRNEVYASVFDRDLNEQLEMTSVILDEAGYTKLGDRTLCAGGDGAEKVQNPEVKVVNGITTSVEWMAELAEEAFKSSDFADVAYYAPVYGKAANAIKPKPLFSD